MEGGIVICLLELSTEGAKACSRDNKVVPFATKSVAMPPFHLYLWLQNFVNMNSKTNNTWDFKDRE